MFAGADDSSCDMAANGDDVENGASRNRVAAMPARLLVRGSEDVFAEFVLFSCAGCDERDDGGDDDGNGTRNMDYGCLSV